jgi:hypothetical protein
MSLNSEPRIPGRFSDLRPLRAMESTNGRIQWLFVLSGRKSKTKSVQKQAAIGHVVLVVNSCGMSSTRRRTAGSPRIT